MTFNPDEGEVFGWVGISDSDDGYLAATGIYDYFWSLKQETREKLIIGWVEALESYLDPEVAERVQNRITGGDLIYFEGEEIIEERPSSKKTSKPGIVLQFPTKS